MYMYIYIYIYIYIYVYIYIYILYTKFVKPIQSSKMPKLAINSVLMWSL